MREVEIPRAQNVCPNPGVAKIRMVPNQGTTPGRIRTRTNLDPRVSFPRQPVLQHQLKVAKTPVPPDQVTQTIRTRPTDDHAIAHHPVLPSNPWNNRPTIQRSAVKKRDPGRARRCKRAGTAPLSPLLLGYTRVAPSCGRNQSGHRCKQEARLASEQATSCRRASRHHQAQTGSLTEDQPCSRAAARRSGVRATGPRLADHLEPRIVRIVVKQPCLSFSPCRLRPWHPEASSQRASFLASFARS